MTRHAVRSLRIDRFFRESSGLLRGGRVAANANQGTDHGTAGPVLVAGHSVRGGFVGEQPGLTDLDDGDLKPTGDFRDVYATMLAGVLDSDPEQILGPGRKVLPLLT